MGIPKEGHENLLKIPRFIVKVIVGIFKMNKKYRRDRIYDAPLMPFSLRVSMKFINEYDTDFSQATIDGRLNTGFDPEKSLEMVKCPMLLLHATWYRHENWGLVGAMDDRDVERVRSLVKDFHYAEIKSGHAIHIEKPEALLNEFFRFTDKLAAEGKL